MSQSVRYQIRLCPQPAHSHGLSYPGRVGASGHEKVQTTLELYDHLYPNVHGNVPQQLQDSAAADLSPAAWQNAQKSL